MPTPIEQHYQERLDALDLLSEQVRQCRDVYWCIEHDHILELIALVRLRTVQQRETDYRILEARARAALRAVGVEEAEDGT
jgi:hypothetical protein